MYEDYSENYDEDYFKRWFEVIAFERKQFVDIQYKLQKLELQNRKIYIH